MQFLSVSCMVRTTIYLSKHQAAAEPKTHVRYLPSSSANSRSTVRSTYPVFCIRVVPMRFVAFLRLSSETSMLIFMHPAQRNKVKGYAMIWTYPPLQMMISAVDWESKDDVPRHIVEISLSVPKRLGAASNSQSKHSRSGTYRAVTGKINDGGRSLRKSHYPP